VFVPGQGPPLTCFAFSAARLLTLKVLTFLVPFFSVFIVIEVAPFATGRISNKPKSSFRPEAPQVFVGRAVR
jgi:hypothetical protein